MAVATPRSAAGVRAHCPKERSDDDVRPDDRVPRPIASDAEGGAISQLIVSVTPVLVLVAKPPPAVFCSQTGWPEPWLVLW